MSSEKEDLIETERLLNQGKLLNHRSEWQKFVDWVDDNKGLSWFFLIFGSPLFLIPTIIFAVALSDKPSHSFLDPFVQKLVYENFSDSKATESFQPLLAEMDKPVRVLAEKMIQERKEFLEQQAEKLEQQAEEQKEKKTFDASLAGKAVSKILLILEKAPNQFPLHKGDIIKKNGDLCKEHLRVEPDLNALSFRQYYSHVTNAPQFAIGHKEVAEAKVVTFIKLMAAVFEMDLKYEEDGPHRAYSTGFTSGHFACGLTSKNLSTIINFDSEKVEKNVARFYQAWERDIKVKTDLTALLSSWIQSVPKKEERKAKEIKTKILEELIINEIDKETLQISHNVPLNSKQKKLFQSLSVYLKEHNNILSADLQLEAQENFPNKFGKLTIKMKNPMSEPSPVIEKNAAADYSQSPLAQPIAGEAKTSEVPQLPSEPHKTLGQ